MMFGKMKPNEIMHTATFSTNTNFCLRVISLNFIPQLEQRHVTGELHAARACYTVIHA